ncbi:MAG: lipocalin family protein [Verrucomicrobiota bacterium]
MISKLTLSLAALSLVSCSVTQTPTGMAVPQTEAKVDVARYAGKWFEVARLPKWFQRRCVSATADYSVNPDGSIKVVNTCIRKDGSTKTITGSAVPVDASANRLKVDFMDSWATNFIPVPAEGNYWILEVTPGYQQAIVGTPDRSSLWFLSRSPEISRTTFEKLKATAAAQGYDTTKLIVDGHTRIIE